MKILKTFSNKIIVYINALTILLVRQTANSACIWVAHQPEFPLEANQFKNKIK